MALNELMRSNIHCSAVWTVIEPTCSNQHIATKAASTCSKSIVETSEQRVKSV